MHFFSILLGTPVLPSEGNRAMLLRKSVSLESTISSSEITPQHVFEQYQTNRRRWPIQITGMVKKPQTINIDYLLHYRPLESRVYRHRCVEAWSMVIPWDGYSLSEFINFCEPLPSAKYVQFISLKDTKQMPNL